jgi:hypothetical protein
MAITLEDFRYKLIEKIINAPNDDSINRYINAALKGLKKHNVNGHIVNRFVAKTIFQLEARNPELYTEKQKENIRKALNYINYSHPNS